MFLMNLSAKMRIVSIKILSKGARIGQDGMANHANPSEVSENLYF